MPLGSRWDSFAISQEFSASGLPISPSAGSLLAPCLSRLDCSLMPPIHFLMISFARNDLGFFSSANYRLTLGWSVEQRKNRCLTVFIIERYTFSIEGRLESEFAGGLLRIAQRGEPSCPILRCRKTLMYFLPDTTHSVPRSLFSSLAFPEMSRLKGR